MEREGAHPLVFSTSFLSLILLQTKPHAAAATHVLRKVADMCDWGGITGEF